MKALLLQTDTKKQKRRKQKKKQKKKLSRESYEHKPKLSLWLFPCDNLMPCWRQWSVGVTCSVNSLLTRVPAWLMAEPPHPAKPSQAKSLCGTNFCVLSAPYPLPYFSLLMPPPSLLFFLVFSFFYHYATLSIFPANCCFHMLSMSHDLFCGFLPQSMSLLSALCDRVSRKQGIHQVFSYCAFCRAPSRWSHVPSLHPGFWYPQSTPALSNQASCARKWFLVCSISKPSLLHKQNK